MSCTIGLLAPIVCACLMAVNGSFGTGLAVMGIFGLVRFRSMPGKGTDLLGVFYAMAAGLLMACSSILNAFVLIALIGAAFGLASLIMKKTGRDEFLIRITMPEDELRQKEIEQVISSYGPCRLQQMKTTHMGTLFEMQYQLSTSDQTDLLKMTDEIRSLNSNLPVSCLRAENLQITL